MFIHYLQTFWREKLGFSGIWTCIVRVEGEHADN